LARDLDRGEEEEDDKETQAGGDDDRGAHAVILVSSGLTVRTRPSIDSTRTRSPGRRVSPFTVRACQSSPLTKTRPLSRTSPTGPGLKDGSPPTGCRRPCHAFPTAKVQTAPNPTATPM